jgi:hypothetical protein
MEKHNIQLTPPEISACGNLIRKVLQPYTL